MNAASTSWNLVLPDVEYWRSQIKCQAACPVHTDARGYVRAIANGEYEKAYLIARGPNPLASICGRICGAPCETACRRGELDAPISIRRLKQFVCERFGPEAGLGPFLIEFLKDAAKRCGPRECQDQDELLPLLQAVTRGEIDPVKGESVGIIGSGPAGLAAAHDLALLGFQVTIYEMEPVLAGMLAVGVPEYRLPRSVIEAEVEVILALGVEAITNCCVGKDVSFHDLRARHDAMVIAVGAKRSRMLPVPGADAEGVIGGVEFLRDVSLGNSPQLGARVVVIGGGNVAYDVGRTVLRQIALDAARTARRAAGVGEVYLCSLESLEEMPADDLEIIEGDEEGIIRKNSLGPQEIVVDYKGQVCGVRFKRCLRVFDEAKRFNPLFDENDTTEIACDNVLISIGQSYDLSFLQPGEEGLSQAKSGALVCDPVTGSTDAENVFVAGDLAYGPKLLIHAVASGKAVARTLYQKFSGKTLSPRDVELHLPLVRYTREEGYEKTPRQEPQKAPAAERIRSQNALVERGFTEAEARCEAGRCLDCGVNTIFDGNRCILCGGCVEVCPETCLRITPLTAIIGMAEIAPVIEGQLDDYTQEDASAILKYETICIRCGLCAERCPTGAITMEQFCYEVTPTCQAV